MSSPPAQTKNPSAVLQSPPIENFLGTVLAQPRVASRNGFIFVNKMRPDVAVEFDTILCHYIQHPR